MTYLWTCAIHIDTVGIGIKETVIQLNYKGVMANAIVASICQI